MSLQLGAIVDTTESATNTILKAAETIEETAAAAAITITDWQPSSLYAKYACGI